MSVYGPEADIRTLQMAEHSCSCHLLSGLQVLWRVAVHRLKLAVGEGEGRWHIHSVANDLDIRPGFAGACSLHYLVELSKRSYTRSVPIRGSQRLRQFGVPPRREIMVSPVRVFLQCALNEITVVVEYEDNSVCSEPPPG